MARFPRVGLCHARTPFDEVGLLGRRFSAILIGQTRRGGSGGGRELPCHRQAGTRKDVGR